MNSKQIKIAVIALLQFEILGFAMSFAQVADPTISVAGGPSTSPQTALLTVSDTTTPVTIYYTTDGTAPTPSSATVTSGSTLLISLNATLKVQAYSGTTSSNVIASQYTNAGMVSAGARHTLILKSNGTVWATGDDTYGELGIGDVTGATKLNPVQVMESSGVPLIGVVNVAAGADESFAVDSSGNVWAWGYNVHGELALGTTTNALYATQITTLTNIIGVASNQYHTLALQANGSVWSFGADGSGQVGNGAVASYVTQATKVVAPNGQSGYLSGIVAVAAGANHSLALDNAGMLWSWGSDGYSQLGDDDSTLTSQTSPVSVINGGTGAALANVIGVAANATNSFALRNDGSVFACGDNSTGELGAGNTTASLTATQVSFLSGSTMTAVGNEAAVDPNGNVWTWGSNNSRALSISNGRKLNFPTPRIIALGWWCNFIKMRPVSLVARRLRCQRYPMVALSPSKMRRAAN